LYYIDEDKVLWGCGRNNYGQLGQGTQDYDFHDEMVKIAENVVHVDYSQNGFTIFLTEDNKLYGIGNAGCGALQQYEEFRWEKYENGEAYTVTTPYLLMENVIYARCGNCDIACITADSNVWIWGTIGYDGNNLEGEAYFEPKPVKVLENAVLITGGWYNHAALLTDGSVWTWGYNYAGNCGVEGEDIVSKPTQVAEDVVMVWTGSTKLNVNCYDISEFGGVYERGMENTIILKRDGSCWACGINVGDEEKTLSRYWEVVDYTTVCSYEFLPFEDVQ
jgi:alpha-tubulin suppressor-like RCC1 family protein